MQLSKGILQFSPDYLRVLIRLTSLAQSPAHFASVCANLIARMIDVGGNCDFDACDAADYVEDRAENRLVDLCH